MIQSRDIVAPYRCQGVFHLERRLCELLADLVRCSEQPSNGCHVALVGSDRRRVSSISKVIVSLQWTEATLVELQKATVKTRA